MKKQLSITIACLFLMVGLSYGQANINLFLGGSTTITSVTLDNTGGTFSLDSYIQFTGFTAVGLSYWLEAVNALAPLLTITSETYGQNWDFNQSGANTLFNQATGIDAGYMRAGRDLGSTTNFTGGVPDFPLAPGPAYLISTLNFSLGANALAPGQYLIALTHIGGTASIISDSDFGDHNANQVFFTINIIPEPATTGLAVLGGLMLLGFVWRARRVLA